MLFFTAEQKANTTLPPHAPTPYRVSDSIRSGTQNYLQTDTLPMKLGQTGTQHDAERQRGGLGDISATLYSGNSCTARWSVQTGEKKGHQNRSTPPSSVYFGKDKPVIAFYFFHSSLYSYTVSTHTSHYNPLNGRNLFEELGWNIAVLMQC